MHGLNLPHPLVFLFPLHEFGQRPPQHWGLHATLPDAPGSPTFRLAILGPNGPLTSLIVSSKSRHHLPLHPIHVKILASMDCLATSKAVRTSCCCAERCARNDCPHGGSFSVDRKTLAHFQSNRTRGKVYILMCPSFSLFPHPTP